jgi:hypothetical protein
MFSCALLATVLLFLSSPLHAEVEKPQSSAAYFVRNFYRWYVPFARAEHERPAFELALKRDASLFSVELTNALLADAAAQAKVSAEVEKKSGRWIFVNFHSPEGGDLISVLKNLDAMRREHP